MTRYRSAASPTYWTGYKWLYPDRITEIDTNLVYFFVRKL